jgi:hypothetical protein
MQLALWKGEVGFGASQGMFGHTALPQKTPED